MIPSGLPYVDDGQCLWALSAEAIREFEKLAMTAAKCIHTVPLPGGNENPRCMYVKPMEVVGKEELRQLCTGAYQKLAEAKKADGDEPMEEPMPSGWSRNTGHP